MKKVLLVAGSLPPIKCGVGYYSARLSRELTGQKVDFEVLSTKGVNEGMQAPLLTVPNWKIRSLPKMLAAIDKSQAEIIHIQYPAVGYRRSLGVNLLPYALRILKPRLKVIVTLHEYHGSRWLGRGRDFITVVPTHKIIVSNQADKQALPKWLSKKAQLIPIGSNLTKAAKTPGVYAEILTHNKLEPKKPTILFFGFAYPAKGLEVLLQAMKQPFLADWQLLLLSGLDHSNSYHRNLLSRIDEINRPKPRVAAAGFLDDSTVSAVLQEGRYFVLPQSSLVNAKSSTAIAAVQHNLVLITRGSDQPELIAPFAHLKNCFLLAEMTAEAISEAIERLEDLPAERKRIIDGTKELEDYFSWSNIVQKHIKLYERL